MKRKPNPRYDVFVTELKKLSRRFSTWEGIAFRSTSLEFARLAKILDGKGSLMFGGRWLAAGNFRAVNLSTTRDTSVKESSANFTYYNFVLSDVRPKAVVGVRLKLRKVIDLTNPRGLSAQPWIRLRELLAEDWRKVNDAGHESESQAFGRAAHDVGAEALLTPSARVADGVNVVFFPEAVLDPGGVEILGMEELERWLKKK